MDIALWVLQALLALLFLATGLPKLVRDPGLTIASVPAVGVLGPAQIRVLGGAEVAGAAGLVLPMATGIAPVLTPVAAGCLLLVMVGAALVHRERGESPAPPLMIAAGLALVAIGRF